MLVFCLFWINLPRTGRFFQNRNSLSPHSCAVFLLHVILPWGRTCCSAAKSPLNGSKKSLHFDTRYLRILLYLCCNCENSKPKHFLQRNNFSPGNWCGHTQKKRVLQIKKTPKTTLPSCSQNTYVRTGHGTHKSLEQYIWQSEFIAESCTTPFLVAKNRVG